MIYSIKYRDYQQEIRDSQIERAQKLIDNNPKNIEKSRLNDYKRFIYKTAYTKEGEVADKKIYSIDNDTILQE